MLIGRSVVVVLPLLCRLAAAANSTLRFVHAIWRHGDRSPSTTFETDTRNAESSWPQGFGELSTVGARQHFELGRWLRRRYDGWVGRDYSAYEIYVRSTDYNRTLMSAQANLAGFYYPPDEAHRFKKDLAWQPIPVHTRPRETDYKLWMEADCPTEERLYQEYLQTDEPRRIYEENKEFIQFLNEKTDEELKTVEDIWVVYDPLFCEKTWNDRQPGSHPWPSWVNATVFDRLSKLYAISWQHYYPTDAILRFRGGPLLDEIVQRMQAVHDTITAALLMALGAYDSPPTYASVVMIELHEIDGQFTVELYYRNDSAQERPYRLEISDCPGRCTLDRLAKVKAHLFPKDWHSECGLRPFYLAYAGAIQALLVLVCMVLFLLLVAVSLAHWRYVRLHRAEVRRHDQLAHMDDSDDDSDDGISAPTVGASNGRDNLL